MEFYSLRAAKKAYCFGADRDGLDCNKLDLFCKTLHVKKIAKVSSRFITDSAHQFAKFLDKKSYFRPINPKYINDEIRCLDASIFLFDHCYALKTEDGYPMIVCAPYSDWSISSGTWSALQDTFHVLKPVEMLHISDEYKFIKNGSISLLFFIHYYNDKYQRELYSMTKDGTF